MHKLIKFLEKPYIVIPSTLIVALILGWYSFKHIGQAPTVSVDQNSTTSTELKNGDEVNLGFAKSGKVTSVNIKIGDTVKKGQILASLYAIDAEGALNQANGALEVAKANYAKILNGITGADIDVFKSMVAKAQSNLDQVKITQAQLVKNAKKNLLNSGLSALPQDTSNTETPPTVSGTYVKDEEGQITIAVNSTGGNGSYFVASGLVDVTGSVSTKSPQSIGDTGLYIIFPSTSSVTNWIINIPNKQSSSYLANLNSYQNAISTESQVVAAATADLDQAQKTLVSKQASARPEDVALAKAQVDSATGTVQIAQGAYQNNFIYAPADGKITMLNIHEGEIAGVNQKVIGMIINLTSN